MAGQLVGYFGDELAELVEGARNTGFGGADVEGGHDAAGEDGDGRGGGNDGDFQLFVGDGVAGGPVPGLMETIKPRRMKLAAPRKFPEELRERAIRLTLEARQDPASRSGACTQIGEQLGINPATLRGSVSRKKCATVAALLG